MYDVGMITNEGIEDRCVMNRRSFLGRVALAGSGVLLGSVPSTTALIPKANKPNILFVLIDDMGWKDISCAGSTYYNTPHIDRLASEGVRFLNAYSPAPVCTPSRGAIFSGCESRAWQASPVECVQVLAEKPSLKAIVHLTLDRCRLACMKLT